MRGGYVSCDMDLRQLEIIRAIADAGSFTAAGEKLRVSQSAISRQILLLEEELGEAVFHRIGRRVRITPAGTSLLQLSHRVFQDLQETVTGISDTRESLRGTMRLIGGMTVCLYVFPALLAEVRRTFPSLDLKITVAGADRSIPLLRSGRPIWGWSHCRLRPTIWRRSPSSRKSCCSSPIRRIRWRRSEKSCRPICTGSRSFSSRPDR